MKLLTSRFGQMRAWTYVAAFLLAALALTWGAREWHVSEVAAAMEERQEERVEEAAEYIASDFERRITALMRNAQQIAARQNLVRGLRAYQRDDEVRGREQLLREVASLNLAERRAVEVYDTVPRLLAWTGFSMPMDVGPDASGFLQEPVVAIASDEDFRDALVVWWPVLDGGRAVGLVRMMEQVRFQAPVQNQYLQSYNLVDTWRRETQLHVEVEYGHTESPGLVLRNAEGMPLTTVHIQEPSAERLLKHTAHFYNGLMAFWLTLLLCMLMAAGWVWYQRVGEPVEGHSVHAYLRRASGRLALVALAWWAMRYVLLAIDVPGRWISGTGPLAPLFDPTHLASTFGAGLMRSTGDLLVTGIFAFGFAAGFLDLATRFRNKGLSLMQLRERLWERKSENPSAARFVGVVLVTTVVSIGLAAIVAQFARHSVLDSTLDYFSRTGLLPDLLTLVVFCALLLITMAVVLLIACVVWLALWYLLRHWPTRWPLWAVFSASGVAIVAVFAIWFGIWGGGGALTLQLAVMFFVIGVSVAAFGFVEPGAALDLLALRRLLPALLLVTLLVYPLLYTGMETQRRGRIVDAVESFSEGRDPRVLFSMEQVLQELRQDDAVREVLGGAPSEAEFTALAERSLRGSLLTSLATYQVTLALFDDNGNQVGQYAALGPSVGRASADEEAPIEFDILRQMYVEMGAVGTMVEQLTGPRARERFQYAGLVPIRDDAGDPQMQQPDDAPDDETLAGWAVVWAEPQTLVPESSTPFPRVLLPAGYYRDLYSHFALAEFREGVLVRSLGRDFGRYRLDESIQEVLRTQPEYWQVEEVKGRAHLTYYQRQRGIQDQTDLQLTQPAGTSVTAVRAPAIVTFDHLYYVLRLFIASLVIGVLLYLLGLLWRWMRGQLPAEQVRFRDKMQNAFLVVGAVSVVVMGIIGIRVLMDENERATQNWLRQRLEQVEETLVLESRENEPPHQTIERLGVDSLAVRVGLDLNLYRDGRLVASSRPRLVRERLISERLPASAFQSLYYDGYRFTTTDERIGQFTYTAGFRALTDEEGRPRYVLSVPTLPEQERMEEEQARTIAYLFGSLLLLVVVIMLTASLLAGALARPIARLRQGLEAVGKGEFARALPVDTRDEIGELVQTFNEMRDQLAESRRKLAQQERELAWREMARQVAHEIKNPLTPMKLSVQHLRRAFKRQQVPAGDGEKDTQRDNNFAGLFDRITTTLIEQIDALARIANEFSTFSRLPTQMPELLDLNEVVAEAVSLMQEEVGVDIEVDLYDEPLVVKADKEELRRAYINLVKNAVQAIPEDQQGKVTVTTTREDDPARPRGWAFSRVTDNGTGIPAELQEKIFQPNFSTKTSGTGLGLAIVRKSVEDMKGEIDFETAEGEGTTFWIRLPIAQEEDNR